MVNYSSIHPFNTLCEKQVADVISLHLPLTPQTQGLINKETLAKMKPKVFRQTKSAFHSAVVAKAAFH